MEKGKGAKKPTICGFCQVQFFSITCYSGPAELKKDSVTLGPQLLEEDVCAMGSGSQL